MFWGDSPDPQPPPESRESLLDYSYKTRPKFWGSYDQRTNTGRSAPDRSASNP